MPGLLEAAAQQQPPEQANQPPEQQPNQAKMSPDNQNTFDLVSNTMKKTLFTKMAPMIVQKLQQGADPVSTMQAVITRLLYGIQSTALQKGKKIPPRVVIQSAMKMGMYLSEIAQKAGVLDRANEAQATEGAVYGALADFANEMKGKSLDQEEANQYATILQKIADSQGGNQQPTEEQPMETQS